jgi:hypothetical protein
MMPEGKLTGNLPEDENEVQGMSIEDTRITINE